MTPEKEIQLCEDVAKIMTKLEGIDSKMDGFNTLLDTHTANDSLNFQKMEGDLKTLLLDKAKASGAAEEAAKHASSAGGKMGGFVATVISLIIGGLSAYFGTK